MEPDLAAIAAASFPVKFNDGNRDFDLGTITIYPSMPFKRFQAAISQKVGLAPHQISTSLVRRKKGGKVPIDEASDFTAITREKDSFVLVSHRRPGREKRSRAKRGNRLDVVGYQEEGKKSAAAAQFPERMILRRYTTSGLGGLDPAAAAAIGGLMPDATVVSLGMWDYEGQMRNIQRQRERFLMSTAATAYYPYIAAASMKDGYLWDTPAAFGASIRPQTPASPPLPQTPASPPLPPTCRECEDAKEKGRSPGFHSCVYDAVTVGFRTLAGPIQRPPKKHHEASA